LLIKFTTNKVLDGSKIPPEIIFDNFFLKWKSDLTFGFYFPKIEVIMDTEIVNGEVFS